MKIDFVTDKPISNIDIHIDRSTESLPSNTTVLWTMSYGDPVMIEYFDLTTEHLDPPSNFCHFDGWSVVGDWGAVSNFWANVDEKFLEDVQPRDGSSLSIQMKWLINYDETTRATRPLWYRDGKLRCGHSVFGHQPVLVEADSSGNPVVYEFLASYPTERKTKMIPFCNALGMPKSMMSVIREEILKGIDPHEKYPYWIQRASGASWRNGKDNIDWYPAWRPETSGGAVNYVFWSKTDWTTNTGTEKMYLPMIGMTSSKPDGAL